jgi:hypothetical protein
MHEEFLRSQQEQELERRRKLESGRQGVV